MFGDRVISIAIMSIMRIIHIVRYTRIINRFDMHILIIVIFSTVEIVFHHQTFRSCFMIACSVISPVNSNTTGETTRVAKIPNRWIFSALWVDGDDPSDGAEVDPFNPGEVEPLEGTYIALSHAENGSIWQQAEIGKTYTYYLEPAEGWTLHSVTFNDTELDIAEGNFVTTPAVSAAHSRLIVTFEQSPAAGVRSAQAGQSQVRVLGTAHGIRVVNAQAGDVVNIFTADGSKVCSQSVNSQQTDIALAPHTLYIIKVGEKVVKVRL